MLLWINGPFGGGKTHTAFELHRRLPGSVVCDPEHVGFGLHRTMPASMRGDFQELASWRAGVVEVLSLVLDRHPGVVIAPMTVTDSAVFEETVGRLRQTHEVRHFALLASPDTVLRRLRSRGLGRVAEALGRDPLAREAFAVERVVPCLERLSHPEFATHIDTEDVSVSEVAERVASIAGLELGPRDDRLMAAQRNRLATTLRHLRL